MLTTATLASTSIQNRSFGDYASVNPNFGTGPLAYTLLRDEKNRISDHDFLR